MIKNLHGLCLTLVLLIPPTLTIAQQLAVTQYSVDEGLQTEFTKSIVQDELGFLWIATDEGLLRFDGVSSTIVSENIPSQYVKDFLKLADSSILVVSDMGISKIEYDRYTPVISLLIAGSSSAEPNKLNYPKSVFQDRSGTLWISENQRIMRYSNGKLKPFTFSADNYSDSFLRSYSFAQTDNGTLYMLSFTGKLYRYNTQGEFFEQLELNTAFTGVNQLSVYKNKLIAASNDGLFSIDVAAKTAIATAFGNLNSVSCFSFSGNNLLYAGTWNSGLYRIDLTKAIDEAASVEAEPLEELDLITYNYLYLSQLGDIWACTNQGLALLQNSFFQTVEIPNTQNYINALAQAGNDFFLSDQSVYKVDFTTPQLAAPEFYFGARNGSIMSIAGDQEYFYAGDYTGNIYQKNIATGAVEAFKVGQEERLVSHLLLDNRANLWASKDGSEGGIYRLSQRGELSHFNAQQGLTTSSLVAAVGNNGKLYVGGTGTNNYLFEYDPVKEIFNNISAPLSFTDKSITVNDIEADEQGNIWLATSAGLLQHKAKQVQLVNLGEQLTRQQVKAIALAADGSIWMANSNGIARFYKGQTFLYDEQSGLPAKTANFRALKIDGRNRLWVGTVRGATFTELDNTPIKQTPKPLLIDVKLNDTPVDYVDAPQAVADYKSYIAIEYLALSYPNNQTLYQTRLLGSENEAWSLASNRTSVAVPSLPQGKYTLQIRAKKKGGYLWSEPVDYAFRIRPPWYLSWWVAVVAIALLALIVFLAARLQAYRLKQQRKRLERIIRSRTDEIREKNDQLEDRNKSITDSIRYAKDIQRAVIPAKEQLRQHFSSHFVLYHPKDMVSGDFYWFTFTEGKTVIAVVDCTGHGVPGAFMSMIGMVLLNDIVSVKKELDPAIILEKLDAGVRESLKQEERKNDDGMDAGICVIDHEITTKRKVEFAGAKVPLLFEVEGKIHRARGDNRAIGGRPARKAKAPFNTKRFMLPAGTKLYLCTDGFADQQNPDGKKLGTTRFTEMLEEVQQLPLSQQKESLRQQMKDFMDNIPQRDDITIVGLQL